MAVLVLGSLITIFILTYVMNKRVAPPVQVKAHRECQSCANHLCSHKINDEGVRM